MFLLHAPLTRYKHIYKCKLGDPELWRAPAPYRSKQTPRAYSDPPPQVCQPATVWLISAAAAAGCCTVQQLGSSWGFQDGSVRMEMLLEPRILVLIAQKNISVLLWCLFDPFALLHRETLPPVEDAPERILLIRISPDQVRRRLLNLPGMMMISAHFWLWAAAHRGGDVDFNFKVWVFSCCGFLREGGMAYADWRCTRLV